MNLRVRVEGVCVATSNIEPDYIMHVHVRSDGKPRRSQPASLRECCTWLSCLQDSVDYVRGEVLTIGPETADKHAVC